MKRYRAIIKAKPEFTNDGEEESVVGSYRMVFEFWIGDHAEIQDPHEIVRLELKALNLTYYTTFTIEELPEDPGNMFEDWLNEQPFGGPSRVQGQRMLADSTLKLMRRAWEAGGAAESRMNAIRAAREEEAKRVPETVHADPEHPHGYWEAGDY